VRQGRLLSIVLHSHPLHHLHVFEAIQSPLHLITYPEHSLVFVLTVHQR